MVDYNNYMPSASDVAGKNEPVHRKSVSRKEMQRQVKRELEPDVPMRGNGWTVGSSTFVNNPFKNL